MKIKKQTIQVLIFFFFFITSCIYDNKIKYQYEITHADGHIDTITIDNKNVKIYNKTGHLISKYTDLTKKITISEKKYWDKITIISIIITIIICSSVVIWLIIVCIHDKDRWSSF